MLLHVPLFTNKTTWSRRAHEERERVVVPRTHFFLHGPRELITRALSSLRSWIFLSLSMAKEKDNRMPSGAGSARTFVRRCVVDQSSAGNPTRPIVRRADGLSIRITTLISPSRTRSLPGAPFQNPIVRRRNELRSSAVVFFARLPEFYNFSTTNFAVVGCFARGSFRVCESCAVAINNNNRCRDVRENPATDTNLDRVNFFKLYSTARSMSRARNPPQIRKKSRK